MADVKLQDLAKSLGAAEDKEDRFTDAFVRSIQEALGQGKDVTLPGLGRFSLEGADGHEFPTSGAADIPGDIRTILGESSEQRVRNILDMVFEALQKELLLRRRVILDGLGAFEVRFEGPQIERQPKGHRLIRPARSVLTFASSQSMRGPVGEGRLVFHAAEGLSKRLETYRESTIMLIVPERDFFAKTLEYYFESAGWDIEVYTVVADALAKIEAGQAYLVILDAMFEDYQKFCSLLKMRRETTNVPLLVMYPSEQAFKVLPDVSIVGDENLAQPFEFRQLLDCADAEILRAAEERLIFLQQINIHLPTDESAIEKVIDMTHKLIESSGLDDEGQVALSAAFREAMVNAAQHGNRYRKDRKIEIQYLLSSEKITLVIKDQGQGFNHEAYVRSGATRDAITAARERHAQGRMGGLGIMLMLRCCDHLEYSPSGNQLTLSKNVKPRG